jgi:hypothetical protein
MYLPPFGKKLIAMFPGGVQRSPSVVRLHGSRHKPNRQPTDVNLQASIAAHMNMCRLMIIHEDDKAHAMRAQDNVHARQ